MESAEDRTSAPLLPSSSSAGELDPAKSAVAKLDWRFLTLCASIALLTFINRVSVGYAANDLCDDLELSSSEYGLSVSLYFFGYLTMQLPGNILLAKFGAPAWCAFLVFGWGFLSALTGLVQNSLQFILVRFFLGVAQGGTFPAIYYLTSVFYPPELQGGAYSVINSCIFFALPVSAPFSAGFLSLDEPLGTEGWRLLLLVDGTVPVLLAIPIFFLMPSSPEEAPFLTQAEKQWLASRRPEGTSNQDSSFVQEMKIVLSCCAWWISVGCNAIFYGGHGIFMFWTTLLIHDAIYEDDDEDEEDEDTCGSGAGSAAIPILLTAIPYLLAGGMALLLKRLNWQNRVVIGMIAAAVGGAGTLGFVLLKESSAALAIVSLSIAIFAISSVSGIWISLTIALLPTQAQRTGSAMTSVLSSAGAFVLPLIVGQLMDSSGSGTALSVLGGACLAITFFAIGLKDPLIAGSKRTDKKETASLEQ